MKKSLLLIAVMATSLISLAQTQLGNGSMEAWTNLGAATEEPTNWNSFKTASGSMAWAASQQIQRSTSVRAGATGTYSARIWSKSVLGVIANGNMTIGQVNMGNSTANHPDNHNWSNTADANFSEALTDSPDSIVFWVKYTPINATDSARLSVVLHDTYNFKDPNEVFDGIHCVATSIYNYARTNGAWVRKSFPINYTGIAAAHTYILVTFATNKTPGGGAANDEVLIDDIELIYNPVNQPMVANDDAITTLEDVAVVIPVLANDTDPENDIDETSVTIVSPPTNGNVTVDPVTGEITYTPNAGYFGTDVFTYSVCDNGTPVLCDEATVTVTITEVIVGNNQIIANDDIAVTDMNVAVVTNVVANDIDAENQIDLTSLVVTVGATNGSTTVNTITGEITYTPNASFFGNDSYTYSICDAGTPSITCDEGVVSVTVNLNWGIEEVHTNAILVSFIDQQLIFESNEDLVGSYKIYTSNGMLIQTGAIQSSVNFSRPNGIYFIHVSSAKGDFIQKIVNL